MGTPAVIQTATFRDVKGQTATVKFFVSYFKIRTDITPIFATMNAITNAAPQGYTGTYSIFTLPVQYGAQGDYENVEDKAVFVFQTDSGDILRTSIPAPKKLVFLNDEETINATETSVAAFIAAYVALVVNRDALPATTYVGGYRKRVRTRKKSTIFTKNPQITSQG